MLGVARSWYHAWQRAGPQRAERAARRAELVQEIRGIFEASKRRYGAPRIHAELRDRGHHLSKRMVAKLDTRKNPALTLNWPPFRPDTRREQGGLGISPGTG
ncbi:IS3 family transposase [Paralimibaculum aggregatum]|uniref:IS3 family transposase n=1 Tax=Paralimibaculum aggregatum TaxID=3036245 RepID=UPI00331CCD41